MPLFTLENPKLISTVTRKAPKAKGHRSWLDIKPKKAAA